MRRGQGVTSQMAAPYRFSTLLESGLQDRQAVPRPDRSRVGSDPVAGPACAGGAAQGPQSVTPIGPEIGRHHRRNGIGHRALFDRADVGLDEERADISRIFQLGGHPGAILVDAEPLGV
jgi:hypothetical protein